MKTWIALSALCASLASVTQAAPMQSGLPGSWEDGSNTISKIVVTEIGGMNRAVALTNIADIMRLSEPFAKYTLYSGLPIGGLSWTNEGYQLDITYTTFGWKVVEAPGTNCWAIQRGDRCSVVTTKLYVSGVSDAQPQLWQQVGATNGMDLFMSLFVRPDEGACSPSHEVLALQSVFGSRDNGQPESEPYKK